MAITLYLAVARACYALVLACSCTFGAWCALVALTTFTDPFAWLASAVMAFILLLLAGRAIVRKSRRGKLIDRPSDHGQWALLFFMSTAGAFAHFLVFAVCLAFYQYRYVYPEKDVEGGPMAFFLMIATASYIVSMLIGEFGLKHPDPRAQPRTSPSSGFADALPGNTVDSRAVDETPR